MSTADPPAAIEHRATIHGKAAFYRLSADALEVRDDKADRTIPLDAIERAGVFRFAELAGTELRLRGGGTAMIHAGEANDPSYGGFTTALHLRLAERGATRFVRGDWSVAAILLALGAALGALALALHQGWLFGDRPLGLKGTLAVWGGFAFAALSPLMAWAQRPRTYDPRALPRGVVTG